MRLVVDLQSLETDSRGRGVGRYAMDLVQALASELGREDELVLAIDMADARRMRDLRNELHRKRVHARVVAYGYPTTPDTDTSPPARKLAGQLRSQFFASLRPDALLIPLFFETGTPYCMALDWSVLAGIATAAIAHDVIPLHFPDRHLQGGNLIPEQHSVRAQELGGFDVILANSESTGRALIDIAKFEASRVVVIDAGFDDSLAVSHDPDDASGCMPELGMARPSMREDGKSHGELRRGTREHALSLAWEKLARKVLGVLRAVVSQKRELVEIQPAWPPSGALDLMADACMEADGNAERALANGLRAIERSGARRVLVDVTEIARLDAKTGIQRVTRKFFSGLLAVAQTCRDFEVEPFRWTDQGIFYARDYARRHLDVPCVGEDELVQVEPSDFVLMLDSSWWSPERFDKFHARVHEAGGEVAWMVYDLIPIRFPQTCDPGMPPAFSAWLSHATRTTDGFICISEATRQDLEQFLDDCLAGSAIKRPWTRSVWLGSDLESSANDSVSDTSTALRSAAGRYPYFVALGTLEPRKDQGTILDAFELLWKRSLDAALVIIGKQGWHVDALAKRISQHAEHGRRLFWLQGAGDGDVRYLLEGAAALIQASIAEGFGLPLVEAGSLDTPLIVSDIPVFHEIAGNGAVYFTVGDAERLADAITARIQGEPAPVPTSVPKVSWREASLNLAEAMDMVQGLSRA